MPGMAADQMRAVRDQASQRMEILIPFSFTGIHVGITPVQLFASRFPVANLMLQAGPTNTGRIHIGADSNITADYGFSLSAGATLSWAVTLTDILQVLGWEGIGNQPAGSRRPEQFNPFRQTRVAIDASQFWAVATAADQDLTIHFSTTPRY